MHSAAFLRLYAKKNRELVTKVGYSEVIRALESLGKLRKLIVPFSRIWIILENEDFSIWL